MNNSVWEKRRKRLFELIEIGSNYDAWCWGYDFFNTFTILLNLAVSIMYTFDNMELKYGPLLLTLERLTVAFFAIDFLLRVFTAKYLYPDVSEPRAIWKYLTSFSGIVDMLSFVPYYMPFFFPSGAVAFRMLRIIRIFRLFRINAYYDSLNVITEVIVGKKQQLLSSVFIILILMISSSLCMYSLENKAQPEVFTNAFSGIWWAASTLLTVGYGDIYPVTTMGKIFGIFIAFLGVGMVAIPTGIISAGFVDQYSRLNTVRKKMCILSGFGWTNMMTGQITASRICICHRGSSSQSFNAITVYLFPKETQFSKPAMSWSLARNPSRTKIISN